MQPESPTPSTLRDAITSTLEAWHAPIPEIPLAHLLVVRRGLHQDVPLHQSANQLLLNLLNQLDRQDAELASLLRLRYLDRMETIQICNRLNIGEATFYRKRRDALERLAEMLHHEEMQARAEQRAVIETRLELPTYERLFGVEAHLEWLFDLLEGDGPPWLVLIEGIGGIGKTALADALVRGAVDRAAFADFGWVTARRHTFRVDGVVVPMANAARTPDAVVEDLATQLLDGPLPSPFSLEKVLDLLQAKLRTLPHLIVIDNLETLADLEMLLPILRRLADPTRFLLTSRERLDGDAFVYPYPIPPLAQKDALVLVRHEAHARNLPTLVEADDADLLPIYETVGGNPLALRLVVGQVHRHALHTVLDDLRAARGRSVEHLYTFIYRRAWETLNEDEQQLFLSMPLVPESGADLDFLTAAGGLTTATLHDALETLVRLNLVDHRGGLRESRYTIHSLTRTFLLEQVIRWQ